MKETEEKKSSARPFLRHRFLSKDEDVQKVPGWYICHNFFELILELIPSCVNTTLYLFALNKVMEVNAMLM